MVFKNTLRTGVKKGDHKDFNMWHGDPPSIHLTCQTQKSSGTRQMWVFPANRGGGGYKLTFTIIASNCITGHKGESNVFDIFTNN